MHPDELKALLKDYLAPILDATVLPDTVPSTAQEQCIGSLDPSRIAVKAERTDLQRVVLFRTQQFSPVDRQIARAFLEELMEMYSSTSPHYRRSLIRSLPIRAISRFLGGHSAPVQILEQYETWAAMTYEGGAITSSIGVDLNEEDTTVSLPEVFPEDFSAVVSNGFDTMLVVNGNGFVLGSGQLSGEQLAITSSPFRLNLIADWCGPQRYGFVLNRLGELLIFRNKELLFAKRRGKWQIYAHETYITRLHPKNQNRALRDSIYASCLDISFARTGGCLVIISDDNIDRIAELVSDNDRIDVAPNNPKSKTIATIVTDTFHNLDRRLRQELLALDGATVLDRHGNVLAVGAIISVPAGSDGGGRRAAAKKGSEYGMGVKISEDGEITAFENGEMVFRT